MQAVSHRFDSVRGFSLRRFAATVSSQKVSWGERQRDALGNISSHAGRLRSHRRWRYCARFLDLYWRLLVRGFEQLRQVLLSDIEIEHNV